MSKERAKPSGRFVLRTGSRLHEQLRRGAETAGLSLNAYCLKVLQSGLQSSQSLCQAFSGSMVPPNLLTEILQHFAPHLEAIVLFGSVARGEDWHNGLSDIDLLLVLQTHVKLTRAIYAEWDKTIKKQNGLEVSPQFVQFPLDIASVGGIWLEVALDGRVLWDPHGKVTEVLRQLREAILSGHWRRRPIHGQHYWERVEKKNEE